MKWLAAKLPLCIKSFRVTAELTQSGVRRWKESGRPIFDVGT